MADLQNSPAFSDDADNTSAELYDWLEELRQQTGDTPPATPVQPAPARAVEPPKVEESALPNWLDSLSSRIGIDWKETQDLQAPTPPAPVSAPATPPATPAFPEANLPDWLRDDTFQEPARQETLNDATPNWLRGQVVDPEWIDDLPDWITRRDQSGFTGMDTSTVEVPPLHDLPDWLSPDTELNQNDQPVLPDLASLLDGQAPPPAEPTLPETGELLPDAPEPEFPSRPNIPDWLKPAAKLEFELSGKDLPPWIRLTPTDDLEWLNQLSGNNFFSAPIITVNENDPEIDFQIAADAPAPKWLEKSQPVAPAASTSPEAETLIPDNSASWLETLHPQTSPVSESAETTLVPRTQPVAPAPESDAVSFAPVPDEESALTAWLESLRPSAPLPTDTQPDRRENEIPAPLPESLYRSRVQALLDGLANLLPPTPATHIAKMPVESEQVQVSPTQESQVQLLQAILAEEAAPLAEPQPLQRGAAVAWARTDWARPILALALAVVIFVYLFSRLALFVPAINLTASPAQEFFNAVQTVPSGATALVVFDYSAASAAELNPGSNTVVRHVLRNGGSILTVSTNPIGAQLANQTKTALQNEFGAIYDQRYLSLGYLPGGATGVQALISDPMRISPYTFDTAEQAWLSNPAFRRFDLVVLIGENPENFRVWVEQLSQQNIKFIGFTTAAAEPLLQAYLNSDQPQLQALVAGRAGLSSYVQLVNGDMPRDWHAFSIAVVMAFFSLLAGVVWAVFSKLNASKERA